MVLNPKDILEKKIIVCNNPTLDLNKHIQQNGIDIDCDKVFDLSLSTFPVVGLDVQVKPKIKEIPAGSIAFASNQLKGAEEGWVFEKGKAYNFDSSFYVKIPEGMCGWVIGRSSFNRYGILIRSSLFDSGFEGYVGATIYPFNNVCVEKGARIAQIVLVNSESASLYQGQWQAR